MTIRPLHDHVVVEPASAKKAVTKGGIILPDTATEKPLEGKVVAVGSGYRKKNGKLVELAVKAGDRVVYAKWSGSEVKIAQKVEIRRATSLAWSKVTARFRCAQRPKPTQHRLPQP